MHYVLGHCPSVKWSAIQSTFLSLTLVNTLYLLWWSLLFMVDLNTDMLTSWRVFITWLDPVKGVAQRTSVLLSAPVHSFLSECTKLWPLLVFLQSLWWISSFFATQWWPVSLALRAHSTALEINSGLFTNLIEWDMTKNSPHLSMKSFLCQLSNYFRSLEKKGDQGGSWHIIELEFLNPPSNLDVNTLKLKLRHWTLSPY